MTNDQIRSKTYHEITTRHPEIITALDNLGTTIRNLGPLEEKTSQLIQLAAAAAGGSEGAVHSHTRRAQQAGATREEINHALLLLISTIGFPKTMAALSWARDILGGEEK
jgi:4-carboxymuconolactone decarboxylase